MSLPPPSLSLSLFSRFTMYSLLRLSLRKCRLLTCARNFWCTPRRNAYLLYRWATACQNTQHCASSLLSFLPSFLPFLPSLLGYNWFWNHTTALICVIGMPRLAWFVYFRPSFIRTSSPTRSRHITLSSSFPIDSSRSVLGNCFVQTTMCHHSHATHVHTMHSRTVVHVHTPSPPVLAPSPLSGGHEVTHCG